MMLLEIKEGRPDDDVAHLRSEVVGHGGRMSLGGCFIYVGLRGRT
jgi:hypothetical protein